jgi:hypothetical protein
MTRSAPCPWSHEHASLTGRLRISHVQVTAAAKAGFSVATARRIVDNLRPPPGNWYPTPRSTIIPDGRSWLPQRRYGLFFCQDTPAHGCSSISALPRHTRRPRRGAASCRPGPRQRPPPASCWPAGGFGFDHPQLSTRDNLVPRTPSRLSDRERGLLSKLPSSVIDSLRGRLRHPPDSLRS